MDDNKDQPFNVLLGSELSSVEFVRDYIQFRFDGPCLTVINDPILVVDDRFVRRLDPGFCDTVISFIGLQVEKAIWLPNDVISICFSGKRRINISLKPVDYLSVEAAIFDDGLGDFWVW